MIVGKEHHHSIDYNLLSKGLTAEPSAGVSREARDWLQKPKVEGLKTPYHDLQKYLGKARHALQFAPRNLSRSLAEDTPSQVDLLERRNKPVGTSKHQQRAHHTGSDLLSSQKMQPNAYAKKAGWKHAHHESLHQLLPDEESSVARAKRNRSSNNELSALGGSINFSQLHSTMNNKEKPAESKSAQKNQFMKKLFEKTLLRRTADMNVANFLVSSTGPRKEFLAKDRSNSGEPRRISRGVKGVGQEDRKPARRGLESTEFLDPDGKSNSELRDKVRKLFNRTLLKTKPAEMKSSMIHRSFQNPSSGAIAPSWNLQTFSTKANPKSNQPGTLAGLVKKPNAPSSAGLAGTFGAGKFGKSVDNSIADPRSRSRKQQKRKSKETKRKESTSKPSTKTGSKQSLSSSSKKNRGNSKPKSRLVTPPPAKRLNQAQHRPIIFVNEGEDERTSHAGAGKINNLSSGKKRPLQGVDDKITPFRSSKHLSSASHRLDHKHAQSSSQKKKSRKTSSRSPKNRVAMFYSRLCELVDSLDHNYNEENIKAISKMFLDYAKLVEEIDSEYPNKPRSSEETAVRNKLLNFFAFFTKMNSKAYTHSKEIISGALGVVEEFVVREHRLLKEYVPMYFEDKDQQSLSLEQAVAMLVSFSDKMVEVNNSLSAYIKSSLISDNNRRREDLQGSSQGQPKNQHGASVISKSDREFEEYTRLNKAPSSKPAEKAGEYRLVENMHQPQVKRHDPGSPRILDYRDGRLNQKAGEGTIESDPRDHDFDDLEMMESESDPEDIEDTPVGKLRREFQLVESKDSQDGGFIRSKDDSNFQMTQDPKQTLSIETQKYALGVKSLAKPTAVQPIGLGLVREPPVLLEKIYSLKKDSDFEYSETSKKKPLGAHSGALSSSAHSTNQKSEVQFNLFSNTLQGSSYQRKEDADQSISSKKDSPEGPKHSRPVPELKLRLGPIQTDGDERMYYSGKDEDRKNPWIQHI